MIVYPGPSCVGPGVHALRPNAGVPRPQAMPTVGRLFHAWRYDETLGGHVNKLNHLRISLTPEHRDLTLQTLAK